MKTRIIILFTALFVLALALTALAEKKDGHSHAMMTAEVGKHAPNFTLTDANGKTHSLSDFKGKYVVLEWVNFGCPFVVKHYKSGNMQNLQAKYTKKGVTWLSICSSAPGNQGYFEGDELKKQIKDNNFKASAYMIDASGEVGRMYNAKTTPNMYIINPEGVLVYAGAIDDKPSTNLEDVEGASNYISMALDQAMAGKSVQVASTQPYGCSVKYSKK
ncbi:MAG: thioredoxin family protein [Candidatus Zixiibacteriota bacterium]